MTAHLHNAAANCQCARSALKIKYALPFPAAADADRDREGKGRAIRGAEEVERKIADDGDGGSSREGDYVGEHVGACECCAKGVRDRARGS